MDAVAALLRARAGKVSATVQVSRAGLYRYTQALSYKMISDRCNISQPTVNSHIQNIYVKLHVSSGIEVVAKAILYKIVKQ